MANHVSDKELISRIHKERLQFHNRETNKLTKERAKGLHRHLFKNDTRWPIPARRDAHQLVIGNGNPKHNEIPPHTHGEAHHKNTSVGWDVEKLEALGVAGENVKHY